jgi:hypothetical protein
VGTLKERRIGKMMTRQEALNPAVAALMEEHSVANILAALVEWHRERAKRAPKAQARKLRWNAAQIELSADEMWPSTVRGMYDDTEHPLN